MATSTYEASGERGRRTVKTTGATAQDAVRAFLAAYPRIQKVYVCELRDGLFKSSILAMMDPAKQGPEDCFSRSFKNREAALAFCQA